LCLKTFCGGGEPQATTPLDNDVPVIRAVRRPVCRRAGRVTGRCRGIMGRTEEGKTETQKHLFGPDAPVPMFPFLCLQEEERGGFRGQGQGENPNFRPDE